MERCIGQDFTTSHVVDLLPGIKLPRGQYKIHIRYTSVVNGERTYYDESQIITHRSSSFLFFTVGRDVQQLLFLDVEGLDNFEHHYYYDMEMTDLILLNLAIKLIDKPGLSMLK